jgi:hypothetical protein
MSNDKKLVLNILGMNNFKQVIHKIAPNGYQAVCGRMLKPKFIVGSALDSEVSCKVCKAGGMSVYKLKQKQRPKNKLSELEDFAHWINNNWYEPLGEDGMWRKNENAEDIPSVNLFTCEDLAIEYLKQINK